MKERPVSQIEKDNAMLDFVNYQAQEAMLDPSLPDWFKDNILSSAIATISQVGERKAIYRAIPREEASTRKSK